MTETARLAGSAEDYRRLGLKGKDVEPWEDGLRTDPEGENNEWWYFDSNLSDGSVLTVVFYTKSMVFPSPGLKPMVDVNLDRPDGTHIADHLDFAPEQFSSSKDTCDVEIGGNVFKGDLHHYLLRVSAPHIDVSIESTNVTPAWRKSPTVYFGDHDEHNFAWLPAIPRGDAEATFTVDGRTETLAGTCYHDHNWGDVSLMRVFHHWYWGRANIGDYTVISTNMIAAEKYGYESLSNFLVARDGEILAEDAKYLTFSTEGRSYDQVTGKPVYDKVIYDYNDGEKHYTVSYIKNRTILQDPLLDMVPEPQHSALAGAGFDGAYMRFSGTVQLQVLDGDAVVESHESTGVWEEMYIGKTLDGD